MNYEPKIAHAVEVIGAGVEVKEGLALNYHASLRPRAFMVVV